MTKLSNIYIQNLTKKATANTSSSVYKAIPFQILKTIQLYENIDNWNNAGLQTSKKESYRTKLKNTSKFNCKKWVEKSRSTKGKTNKSKERRKGKSVAKHRYPF